MNEAFTHIIDDSLRDGDRVGIDIGWDHDVIRAVIAENAGVLDEVTEPRLVELDLWTKNSMIRDGRIVAVLDHERAIYGDPLIEAGLTGLDMPMFGDPSDFMTGFGVGELTEAQRTRRRLYSLYHGEIAERLASVFPDFRLEVFPGRHHFDPPHRVEPDRVAASLRALWQRAQLESATS